MSLSVVKLAIRTILATVGYWLIMQVLAHFVDTRISIKFFVAHILPNNIHKLAQGQASPYGLIHSYRLQCRDSALDMPSSPRIIENTLI